MAKALRGALDEIMGMARADHAYQLGREHNPYPEGTDRGEAWYKGWDFESGTEHKLDEEMAKLPYFRVRTWIVSGGEKLVEVKRGSWARFTVSAPTPVEMGAVFESREASEKYPDKNDVRIRAEYERAPKGGVED